MKIISGEFSYCVRTANRFCLLGWRIVKSKRLPDNKWIFVLENDNEYDRRAD